jgi:hypothetical protein
MGDDVEKLCFVIGPIGDEGSESRTHANWLLDGIIRPVFSEHFSDFVVQRADEIKAPGDINSQVINRIMDAELVIADMSMHNANAFYELAVRHMVRLPTIHIIHKDFKIPFDVAPHRAIRFSRQEFSDLAKAKAELKSVVDEVISPGFVVENPVTHARAKFELDQHATPAMQALASDLAALRGKLDDVQEQMEVNRELVATHLGIPPMVGLGRSSIGLTGTPPLTTGMFTNNSLGGLTLAELGRIDAAKAATTRVADLNQTLANIDQLRALKKDDKQ